MEKPDIFDTITKSMKSVVSVQSEPQSNFLNGKVNLRRGSGIVVDKNSIVTNAHIIKKAEMVHIVHNSEILNGKVVNSSKIADLALIKVEETLPASKLGNSYNVRIGQTIYLLGNPFGLRGDPTVSSGIISSLKRSIRVDSNFMIDMIQTDAHLNPGNSGGPLIDVYGNVLGVTTALIPNAQGIGFSIPINTVKDYISQVFSKGMYSIPGIGIDGVTITPGMNRLYDLGSDHGVLITKVFKGSPAYEAGLSKRGWLSLLSFDEFPKFGSIISFNGRKVPGFEELLRMIRGCVVGSRVKLGLLKNGTEKDVDIKIGELY